MPPSRTNLSKACSSCSIATANFTSSLSNSERIAINSLQDNTFYASIAINDNGQIREIDARPSDAIAIAIRTKAPIWVIEEVIADASIPVDRDADEQERQAFSNFVSNLCPDDLIRKGGYAG